MAARRSPKPQAWVRFLLLLPRRVSQVGRRLSAKQSNRRFDSDPRLHSGQHWCAGGPYKPVIAPDQGARQSSILWTTTIGLVAQPGPERLATNEKVAGSNPVEPSMFFSGACGQSDRPPAS